MTIWIILKLGIFEALPISGRVGDDGGALPVGNGGPWCIGDVDDGILGCFAIKGMFLPVDNVKLSGL